MPSKMLMPGGEPFFFPRGKIGCLLVHGFTGAPNEMRWMGEWLANKGYTVLGIRLPGHGTRPEDMHHTHWEDWAAAVEDGYEILRGATDEQFLAGLSLGGALTLYSAARLPVSGAITVSAIAHMPNDWRIPYIRPFSRLQPRIQKGPGEWRNPEAAMSHVEYPYYPTIATAELRDFLIEVRASIPEIHVPMLMVHSRLDKDVSPEQMPWIFERLGTDQKEMLWVENSNHVVVREPDRELVFEAADRFIKKYSHL